MQCPTCGLDTGQHERHCPNCLSDLGFPNVRAARLPDEVSALDARFMEALANADAEATRSIVDDFAVALESSAVVVCRQYGDVYDFLKSDNELYASFALLVEGKKRRPSAAPIDLARRQTDAIFFPYFEKEIRFAALSLDGLGAAHYGPVSIVLAPSAIRLRTSFFEKNTVEFAIERKLGPGRPVPPGFRSDWDRRHKLAVAKGHGRIRPSTAASDFPRIVLDGDEFIEAHIYGPLHRRAIQRLVARYPRGSDEMAYLLAIQDLLAKESLPIKLDIV
ncbi:MAG: hypothetical protein U0Q16_22675 [Bryobacteraceae bacterium]